LSFLELTGSELRVKSKNFADEESESPANTLDFIESKRDSSFTINVGVEDTVNVLEVVLSVFDDQ